MCSTYFDCPLYHELCDTYSMRDPNLLRSPAPGGGHFFTPGHGTGYPLTPGGGAGSPQSSKGPTGAPPTTAPSKAQATSMKKAAAPGGLHTYALTIGSIQPCLNRLVYLWLNNGYQFWAWLVYGNDQAIWGYYWNGFTWDYFGMDLNSIDSFYCA